MIVKTVCDKCKQSYRLLLQTSELSLVAQIMIEGGKTCLCPRLCGGSISLVGEAPEFEHNHAVDTAMSITGKQLYTAVNGAGLPDEIPKDKVVVQALLESNKVIGVDIEQVNDQFYLHELKLEQGLTIHLASGPRGALILKVTKEKIDGP